MTNQNSIITSDTCIPLQMFKGCLVASIQADLNEKVLDNLRNALLEKIQKKSFKIKGVILDVSGLNIMDLEDFNYLKKIMSMVKVMGSQAVFSGMNPGIVSALVDAGASIENIRAVSNLDEAYNLFEI